MERPLHPDGDRMEARRIARIDPGSSFLARLRPNGHNQWFPRGVKPVQKVRGSRGAWVALHRPARQHDRHQSWSSDAVSQEPSSRSAISLGRIEGLALPLRRNVGARRLVCFLGVVAVLSGGGCSSDGDERAGTSPSTTTTAAITTTITTGDQAEAAVLAGYRAFWVAFLRAGDPMEPQHPDLVATATGAQLEQVQRAFVARLAGGEVIRGRIEPNPRLDGPIQGTTATVVDCYVDDSHVFDAVSGAQKDDPAPVNQQVRAEMQFVDASWRVAAIRHEGKGCTPS